MSFLICVIFARTTLTQSIRFQKSPSGLEQYEKYAAEKKRIDNQQKSNQSDHSFEENLKQKSGESQTDQNESDSITESSRTPKIITDLELIDEYIQYTLINDKRTLGAGSDSYFQMIIRNGLNHIERYYIDTEYKQLLIKLNTKLPFHATMNKDFIKYLFKQKIHDQRFFIGVASSNEIFNQKIPAYVEGFKAFSFYNFIVLEYLYCYAK